MLYSRTQGQGEPVILLHGLFGSMENLGALARPLAEHFAVHSVDLPNHGRSPHTDSTDLPAMANAVAAWMDAQGIHKAHIIGHSLGGKTAMELALSQPARISGLVVIDIAPVHYPPHHNEVFKGLSQVNPAQIQQRGEAEALMLPFVPETAVRSFLLKNLVKEADGFRWRMNLPVISRDYPALIAGNRAGVYTGPVLFVKGGNSDYVTSAHKSEIMARFPSAQLKIVPDTGHWLHAEKPDLVSGLTLRFLQGEHT
ncbi:MAG TPA: alpha/beta fold hydrolase [Cellvibrionaceae bacterium]|nr:alpha/beta fold hydrolase [Cellvibrionaceae bacterium]HMW47492.1 alpha/beta fold hydrolase [Cellvibrionaceae bacterium]HMW71958.1 alpha/beta fold hydrolase [Cellvibrionaceae bacterium]HNG59082.1 alpha/beta fold hydrolase [Cellvibrionaceae bacterium]